ncbi:hypothetical protein DM02DRAFT_440689 [Periconia macrospinosa]|uniref:Uncharacterized protein n=1 Tax=Periconia macrospinosa TaxID=97972 RepID=A0A2V1DPP3_9PLEO|nr:hypothetical protein DM02DRAFT_440689 [Periconia macrospinosa]
MYGEDVSQASATAHFCAAMMIVTRLAVLSLSRIKDRESRKLPLHWAQSRHPVNPPPQQHTGTAVSLTSSRPKHPPSPIAYSVRLPATCRLRASPQS